MVDVIVDTKTLGEIEGIRRLRVILSSQTVGTCHIGSLTWSRHCHVRKIKFLLEFKKKN